MRKLGVLHDRMIDAEAIERAAQVLDVLLVLELRRVDADHDQLVAVFPLEIRQVRHQVQAVDAAVGPEVEQHHLAAQLAQRQRRRAC